jgi:biotin transport system substrate-specific component
MQVALSQTFSSPAVRQSLSVISFAALTALAAQLEIPLVPVPITMQTAAVLAAGALCGARLGAYSQIVYLIAGLFLPIYSGGGMGAEKLLGATGGYLLSFPMAAAVCGLLVHKEKSVAHIFTMVFLASLVTFAVGMLWLKVALNLSFETAFAEGVYPFIIGDVVKCGIVAALVAANYQLGIRKPNLF